jgi:hypothetical protein
MTDQDIIDALADTPEEDFNPETLEQNILKPHPDLVAVIVGITSTIIEESPEVTVAEALYLAVKECVKAQHPKPKDLTPSVFAYYLEAYSAFMLYKHNHMQTTLTASPLKLYNEAALSVFDLYAKWPFDKMVRAMLQMAARAFHQVSIAFHTVHNERPMAETFGDLSTIALLSQTVGEYVKGSRRSKNYAYIAWLKTFFEETLNTPDLSFMKDNPTLGAVVTQISKSVPVIKV